jgi:hypothetical protein
MLPPTAELIAECKRKAMASMKAYRLRQAERKLHVERLAAWELVTETVPAISDEGRRSPLGENFSLKFTKSKKVQMLRLACFEDV